MAIPALGSGQSNLQTPIWGCHRQLDDQHRNPNMNNKDHLVGRLTSIVQKIFIESGSRFEFLTSVYFWSINHFVHWWPAAGEKKVAENWEPEAKRQFGCKEHRLVALMLLLLHTDMSSHKNFPSYIDLHKHPCQHLFLTLPDQPKDITSHQKFLSYILHLSSGANILYSPLPSFLPPRGIFMHFPSHLAFTLLVHVKLPFLGILDFNEIIPKRTSIRMV